MLICVQCLLNVELINITHLHNVLSMSVHMQGTGTNACYVEKLENVELWDGDKLTPRQVLCRAEQKGRICIFGTK